MNKTPRSIGESELQRLLLERAAWLRRFVTRKIPKRFQGLIAPDDILQETWIAAHRSVHAFRFDGPDAFERWLTALTIRRLVDAFRAASAVKRGGFERRVYDAAGVQSSCSSLFAQLVAGQKTPSRELAAREASDAVQIALCGLPEPRRQAVRMHYLEGRSRDEIARQLHKSEAAVNSLIYHGLRALRARLGDAWRYLSGGDQPLTRRP